jgi:DNA adenine methylase
LSGFNLLLIEEELSAIHLRLARVYIENKSYEDVIAYFDRPETFFYLDPP